nr:MAG TPA: major capsid protein [Caudoviricetes sp.]
MHQSRDLRDDPAWINASNYGAPNLLFLGEIGKIDDTRFIETTILNNGLAPEDDPAHDTKLAKAKDSEAGGNATNVFQAVLFGDKYFGMAVSLPVELRDNGVIDYGRERGLAWYSIMGAGLLHEKHGVVIETA